MGNLRLRRLNLVEFRCFAEAEVDLSADVTAIYGRNGVGKTAIFDAIEFALFGSIDRLEEYGDNADYVSRVGGSGDPRVRLEMQLADDIPWVETTWSRSDAHVREVNGSATWHTHRDLLYGLLVDESQLEGRREVASIRELFRATLALSQDSIRKFVEEGPEERAKVIARLAGLAHIQRSRDKAQEVTLLAERERKRLSTLLSEVDGRSRELELRVAELVARQRELRSRLGEDRPTLSDLADALEVADIEAGSAGADPVMVARIARAKCDERQVDLDSRSRRVAVLEAGLQTHLDETARLVELEAKSDVLRSQLAAEVERSAVLSASSRSAVAALRQAERATRDLSQSAKLIQTRIDASTEVASRTAKLDDARAACFMRERALADAREQFERHRVQHSATSAALRLARHEAGQVNQLRDDLSKLRDALLRTRGSASQLSDRSSELSATMSELRDLESSLPDARASADAIRSEVAEAETILAQVRAVSETQAELVSRLREMATGDSCPLCGVRHESHVHLLEAIDRTLASVPEFIQSASRRLQTSQTQLIGAEGRIRELVANRTRLNELAAQARAELDRLGAEQQAISSQADQLAVPMSESVISQKLEEVEERSSHVAQSVRSLESEIEVLERAIAEAEQVVSQATNLLSEARERAERDESDLSQARIRMSEVGQPDGTVVDLERLQRDLAATRAGLLESEEARLTAEMDRQRAEDAENSCMRVQREIRDQLHELDAEVGQLKGSNDSFRGQCAYLGFDEIPRREDLDRVRGSLERLRVANARARDLSERVEAGLTLEALDSEKEGADFAVAAARGEAEEIRGRHDSMERARETAKSWIGPLSAALTTAIERTVVAHQLEIERHFRAMIPAPHLFDAISLRHSSNRLDLGVRYRDQNVTAGEPRMFLSNAQLNVLALAIFLSLGAKQRWSHLGTLLLDDPIQHLDDLDAVAFLDTLRAVALGRFGKRKQIIVSTCDRDLYRIMIQKFRMLEAAGATFSAISLVERGSSGPVVHYDAASRMKSTGAA